jgi:hypothetical protein
MPCSALLRKGYRDSGVGRIILDLNQNQEKNQESRKQFVVASELRTPIFLLHG